MKYISIAFVILAAGANFASAQTLVPNPRNLGSCPYYDVFLKMGTIGATQWEHWSENYGGETSLFTYYATPGNDYKGEPKEYFKDRILMNQFCAKIAVSTCGENTSANISITKFWPN
jgi:hypothetical protein